MRRVLCAAWAILVLMGCESGRELPTAQSSSVGLESGAAEGPQGYVRFPVSFAPWRVASGKSAAVQSIDQVVAYVYDPSGYVVTVGGLTLSSGRATGRLTVPAQNDLRAVLVYLDGPTVRYIGADEDVDVSAGGETTADILVDYMGTTVTAPDSAEVGADYEVSWMARPYGSLYEVQEATSSDFADTTTIYSDFDTAMVVPAKAQAGVTYYYRARVLTEYGFGPWHSTGFASTGTFAVEGTIIVDTPVPPDEPMSDLLVQLPGGATMAFAWIEPGTFTMGSPSSEPDRNSDEGPQHEVTISRGFWLGKYEITQGQWEAVMGTTPWAGQSDVRANSAHPAVYISWNDVQEMLGQLNDAAGIAVYRLPTEAEWEYACRSGTTTRWSFGEDEDQLGDYAWYYYNAWDAGLQYAQPVGTKLPNAWDLFDMHGNVWEWVQDREGPYSSTALMDPQGPATGSSRVARGGAFNNSAHGTRAAYRYAASPGFRLTSIGARLARSE